MSSKSDIDGGLTDPFEGLTRTIPLETYRIGSKRGDAGLDGEATIGSRNILKDLEDACTTPTTLDNFPMWTAGQVDLAKESMIDSTGDVPQTISHKIVAIAERHESSNADSTRSDIHSQGTECWMGAASAALEEGDSRRCNKSYHYSLLPMEDVQSKDGLCRTRLGMQDEPIVVTLV
jgi:hypothetical protein